MNGHRRSRAEGLWHGVAVAIAVLLCSGMAGAGDVGGTGPGGSAMRAYRDPATGALGAPAPSGSAEASVRASEAAPATKASPLVAEPVEGPAGGVKVKLHGRFQAAVRRQVDGDQVGPYECVHSGTAAHE